MTRRNIYILTSLVIAAAVIALFYGTTITKTVIPAAAVTLPK
jgi:hypothetical protein